MMELVKTHLFNLILHVRRVIQVQIDTSRYGVKCPDLIGNAGGQYMFLLHLFIGCALAKLGQVSAINLFVCYLGQTRFHSTLSQLMSEFHA